MMEVGGAIEKMIGIAAGAFLSLIFIPPKSVNGFVRRISAAIVFGWIFGHLFLALLLRWTESSDRSTEDVIAAWAISSFSSWIAMGAYSRHLRNKAPD